MEDWALIRRLHLGEGVPKAQVAKRLGISRNTVAKAVSDVEVPSFKRKVSHSIFDPFEQQVRALLEDYPLMPASVIAERIGWEGAVSWLRKKVALLRPEYAPKDPADRLSYLAGDQAQCDLWFPPVKIPTGHGQLDCPPVLVIVASFSRFVTAMMLPTRSTPDLLAGMWSLITGQLGAVPRRLVWDNEAGIGRRNVLASGVAGFCGVLATRIVQLKPFDPESKGIVERANQYLETSFLPGRSFASPDDFNEQLADWLIKANTRLVRSLHARPTELITVDRQAMLPLPPVAPMTGFIARVRLPRDYYVRVLGNDYSVDPTGIGRMLDIRANLNTVQVTLQGRPLASHERVWGHGHTITDPEHILAAARLRQQFQSPRPVTGDTELERDLADYDAAFAVDIHIDGQVA